MWNTRPGRPWKLIALALLVACAGCGGDGSGSPATTTNQRVSPLTARVTELSGRIAEYCEVRNSGSATAADRAAAVADVRALIALARKDPDATLGSAVTVRDALAQTAVVINADCRDPRLERRVKRALTALP